MDKFIRIFEFTQQQFGDARNALQRKSGISDCGSNGDRASARKQNRPCRHPDGWSDQGPLDAEPGDAVER